MSQGSRFQSAFKVQRSSRKGVGASAPKRRTPHWGDDMISSAGRPVAALNRAVSASRPLAKNILPTQQQHARRWNPGNERDREVTLWYRSDSGYNQAGRRRSCERLHQCGCGRVTNKGLYHTHSCVVNSESQWRVERHWLSDHTEQDECPNMTVEYVPYAGPIVTRAEALARGLPRWFIGKSCKRDHISERRTTDGVCVACVHALTNAWKTANRDKINADERQSRLRDPETHKARTTRYLATDKAKAVRRAYYLANVETIKQRAKDWKEQNPERSLELRKAYYEANKEYIVGKVAEWHAANPDGQRTRGRNYRAKLHAAEGSHTREQIAALHDSQGGKCVYCRVSLKNGYHADHIRPLSKGGSNWITNIQLTCGPCNNRKRATDPIEFAQRLGRLL